MAKKIERNHFSGPRAPILMLRVPRVTILILCVAPRAGSAQAAGDTSLVGLWAVKKRFGYPMGPTSRYGYLWWMGEYPSGGRTLHYYLAAGNGGQISLAIPDLDLAVAAFGGNSGDRSAPTTMGELIPKCHRHSPEPTQEVGQ
jgi:CubicO group peptidase (beta-lactamase class C family)